MTLAEDGWTPVTVEQSRDGYTWRVWVDAGQNFTFLEVFNESGKVSSGGFGEQPDVSDEGLRFWVSQHDGFPTFVGVRFAELFPRMAVETSHRTVIVGPEHTEAHSGHRYYAMPLQDGEELFSVVAGSVRKRHNASADIGRGPTGFYPSER